jgi:hypothetical protein
MHRTTLMIPEDLKERAAKQAQERGVSLGELVREALRECVERAEVKRSRASDPIFYDDAVFDGDSALDLAARHDEHLYGRDEE